ncbi:MAG: sulfite dehydrogenase [Gemmatimonadetes bacterium]|nr:sulfite dehydrogenase [Gemmatimonadota bacterium]MYA10626.1 sulfite dehydrogenase [Gemmatimonadota bacterium]MYE69097.1 sulfite dehydrogenase [Gemmatimonadota bacterium]MYJ68735.1 sulfite dehydrogenase [Gemmatimonadota bacterium]
MPNLHRPGLSRRAWLAAATGTAATGLALTRLDALKAAPFQEPPPQLPDPTKVPGRFVSELGRRATGEQPRRLVRALALSSSSRTPLHELQGTITPSDLHFERHHAGVPEILAENHELLVHGMVDRPMVFRMPDLRRYPQASRICFIECSGNGGGAYSRSRMPTTITAQQLDGLLSTSEWTGVMLSTILREVGVKPGASWILAEGADAAVMARSVPLEKAMDDAMLAYGQNGEAIRPEQGYPLRLLLPGWEGNAMVKWLRRIEVSDRPTMTRDETSRYTDPLKDGTARQFSFVMEAKSVITFPSYPYVLPARGWWEIEGLAWTGRGRITRVEVSTDGGRSWTDAALQRPILPKSTVRFRHLWNWDGRQTVILSRATDETRYVQPTVQQLWDARGEGTSYHHNHQRAWRVAADGAVTFGLGDLL